MFERFREAQERAALFKPRALQEPIPVERETTISPVLLIVGVVVFVALGLIWTAKRRTARASVDRRAEANAMLNDINRKGIETRRRIEEDLRRAQATRAGTPEEKTSRPVGLSEEDVQGLLEQCSGFTTSEQVLLPKKYSDHSLRTLRERYPFFRAAEKIAEVERDGETYILTIPQSARDRMHVTDTLDEYAILLGERIVTSVHDLSGSATNAAASFEFTFEEQAAAETMLAADDFSGSANFLLKNGSWEITRAVAGEKSLCP